MRVSSKASRGDRFYFAVDTPTGVNVLRDSYTTLPDATPDQGRVVLAGHELELMSADEVARLRLASTGFIHQDFALIDSITAVENVAVPLRLAGVGKRDALERASQALSEFGLGQRLRHRPAQLSGGEKQRVAVARAVIGQPPLVIADEPTGALDAELRDDALRLILEACQDKALLLVTHDPVVAARAGARILRLAAGRLMAESKDDTAE